MAARADSLRASIVSPGLGFDPGLDGGDAAGGDGDVLPLASVGQCRIADDRVEGHGSCPVRGCSCAAAALAARSCLLMSRPPQNGRNGIVAELGGSSSPRRTRPQGRAPAAQSSPSSSRSLPQKTSPSSVTRQGAPMTPIAAARAVSALSRALLASALRARQHALRDRLRLCEDGSRASRDRRSASRRRIQPGKPARENSAPLGAVERQRDARGEQAVLRERIGARSVRPSPSQIRARSRHM